MGVHRIALAPALAAALGLAAAAAHATDGYFSHGYGMKEKGMGGASFALAQDAFGGANNPATMVFAGNRFDIGVDWFSPHRTASRSGSIGGVFDFSADSDSNNFFIPELAYNRLLSPDMSLGVTVYGNGGMNTDYPGAVASCGQPGRNYNGLCGQGRLGVDLSQLIVAPAFAIKLAPSHAVGVAPLLAYQRFKAQGLQGFEGLSSSPSNVTNNGYASSTGYGLRVGYNGRLTSAFSIGAVYATKTKMGKFDAYKGLFAQQGAFDIPEHYGAGVAFDLAPGWQLAADYERIVYSGIASVHNPSSNQAPLGADNGPGFGWQDVNVLKLGIQWAIDPKWTVRAGYNHTDNPIRSQDVSFNILAPGVVQDHYTLGATLNLSGSSELTLAYMYARRNSVSGPSLFNSPPPVGAGPGNGGSETIAMHENSLGIAWGIKF